MSAPSRLRLAASARVLLAMTAVLIVTIAILVAAAYGATSRALTAGVDDVLRREAAAYRAAIRSAPGGEDLAQVTYAYFSGRGAGGKGSDVVLVTRLATGRTIANSDVRITEASGSIDSTTTAQAGFRTARVAGEEFRVLTTPIVAPDGARLGTLEAALSVEPVRDTARRVALTLGAAGLLALAIGVPLSSLAMRGALRPLTQMAEDAEEISHAAPGGRIAYDGPADELGTLAAAVNSMVGRLERAYEDQRRFIADASHELRTPVAVVRGNVELLRAGAITGADAEESLAMIEGEAVRMSRMLDELLSLARFDAAHEPALQPLNVRALLDEASARARSLAERQLTVRGDCDLWIAADPTLIDQLLANLIRNAIAHTADGGSIEFGCLTSDGSVEISVADDGPGIPEADLDRVFDRFYRAPGERSGEAGGAGLGLAIAKRIAELHGGGLRAENVAPHGARFVITLPPTDAM